MVEISRIGEERWEEYRELRLAALKSEPIAFGSAFEEEERMSEGDWKQRLKNVLFAVIDDKLIGMIVLVFNSRIKTKHIANIFGVYVENEYRGQGIGKKLMEAVLDAIEENGNIVKINLSVNIQQKAAISLYKECGFETVGILKKELIIDEIFYDELIMEKFL
ncbi:MAG TPA: GNAT family N-acetyltransferase [Candidatus Lokiarchaeia archaeon]|nr:GNAT family N-acetyltransferase [Candidatus Lokiarchaeia archaeon]